MKKQLKRATELVNVVLTDEDMKDVTLETLYRLIGKTAPKHYDSYKVEKGKLVYSYEESGGSHSWFSEDIVRDATDLDVQVLAVIAAIEEKARAVFGGSDES